MRRFIVGPVALHGWVALGVCIGCAQTAASRETLAGESSASKAAERRAAPPAVTAAPAADAPELAVHAAAPSRPLDATLVLADVDPDNDFVVAPPEPLADCAERLTAAKVRFQPTSFPLQQKRGNVFTCGTEQAVIYQGGPEGLRYDARPHVTCRLALALARFEVIVREEAETHLGRRVRKLRQAGTYSCRKMQRFTSMVSEHSYANAIDIKAFELEGGKSISVLSSFGALDAKDLTPEARFLRSVARRAYDEAVFSVVLTPYFDSLHRDHFHLDMARYRLDGTR